MTPHIAVTVPGPRAPVPVQFLRLTRDFIGYLEECADRYGDVFSLRLPYYRRVVVATGPDDVHAILTDGQRFVGGNAGDMAAPILGRSSLMLTSGVEHRRQRKLLMPAFHGDLVIKWRQRIAAIAAAELDRLPTGRRVPLHPISQRITFETLARLVLGIEDAGQIARLSAAVLRVFDPRLGTAAWFPGLIDDRQIPNPLRFAVRRRLESLHVLIEQQIAARRSAAAGDGRDALGLLLSARDEDGLAMTDLELRGHLLTLLIGGHEATAAAVTWSLELLSHSPHAVRRLETELTAGTDRRYRDAVLNETLRVRSPSIWNRPRMALVDTVLGEHPIAADTVVLAASPICQRRASEWPNPLEFRPERFLHSKPAPGTWMPFGGGVHRCIGASLASLEMQVVLEAVLSRFDLAAAGSTPERARLSAFTLVPSRGGRVALTPRAERLHIL
jgi:cytochrome P450